ncbi:ubiquitin-protein ligase (E3) [Diatrype stigma]|uniref:HECT-type E3 ubiquitin transferase n=1 Tax=Diatrype stigma TaxID=117547 RepID=A0AAN9UZU9_9PEZI
MCPATSRIRSSNLNLLELKQLIEFLKNLSFTLYHDLDNIFPSTSQPVQLNSFVGFGGPRTANNRDTANKLVPSSFAGIIGMDVLGLRNTVVTTLHSLYERDSRRSFLPKGFWLMPKKFDMRSFVSAAVLEEQQKDEMDQGEESDSDGEGQTSFHNATISRLSRAARIEQNRGRGSREKFRAKLEPKLEILRNMPFIIPFDIRVQIFREFVNLDKDKRRGGNIDPDRWRLWILQGDSFSGPSTRGREVLGRHSARVKRGVVFDDAFNQFYTLGEGLKEPIQITFVDQFDQPEAGIDGGGVTKEFLTSIADEAFNPGPGGHNFFAANKQNLLYPNPTAFDEKAEQLRFSGFKEGSAEWVNGMQDLAKRYEFLGRIVGKCMYEGILVDIAFAPFFLLKWSSSGQSVSADYRANLNDLRDLDPELYQGLINLKNYPGDVGDLSLNFAITDQIRTPDGGVRTVTRPLRKDGENITVTNKDRPLYISYVASHRLVAQPYRQTKAFLRGLGSIINPAWLSMFNQSELQRLVGGDSSEIDVEDLRHNTIYSGLYAIGDDGMEHPTVQMFWQVMHSFHDEERREVLKYVTSTPRAPLLGFSQLSPHFSIRDGGIDEERLPSTSTCVNLLKLPRYSNPETLKNKLLYAIKSGAGFDLS